jgi:hypothetical protein
VKCEEMDCMEQVRHLAAELYDDLYTYRDVHFRSQQLDMIVKAFSEAHLLFTRDAVDAAIRMQEETKAFIDDAIRLNRSEV